MSDRQKTDHVNKSYTLYEDRLGNGGGKTLVRNGSKYHDQAKDDMARVAKNLGPTMDRKNKHSVSATVDTTEWVGGSAAGAAAMVDAEDMKRKK
jgi:hypothetical protein